MALWPRGGPLGHVPLEGGRSKWKRSERFRDTEQDKTGSAGASLPALPAGSGAPCRTVNNSNNMVTGHKLNESSTVCPSTFASRTGRLHTDVPHPHAHTTIISTCTCRASLSKSSRAGGGLRVSQLSGIRIGYQCQRGDKPNPTCSAMAAHDSWQIAWRSHGDIAW